MTIEKNHDGAWIVSDIIANGNYLFTRRYYGYTKREALARFKAEVKEKTYGVYA